MTSRLLADLAGAGELIADPDILASYRTDQAAPGLLVLNPRWVDRSRCPRSTAKRR